MISLSYLERSFARSLPDTNVTVFATNSTATFYQDHRLASGVHRPLTVRAYPIRFTEAVLLRGLPGLVHLTHSDTRLFSNLRGVKW